MVEKDGKASSLLISIPDGDEGEVLAKVKFYKTPDEDKFRVRFTKK